MIDQNDQPDFSGAAATLAQAQEVMQKRRDELAAANHFADCARESPGDRSSIRNH